MTSDQKNLDERILIFAPIGRDAKLAASFLKQNGFSPEICHALEELSARIAEGAGAALVTEEALLHGKTRSLSKVLKEQPEWSDFPILLLIRSGTEPTYGRNAWWGLEQIGNVSIIERPIRPVTLVSAVQVALAARRRQYEVRNHLLAHRIKEEELRISEERFRVALQHSPIRVFQQNRNLRYTWVYNALHWAHQDRMVGRKDQDILSPRDAAAITRMKRKVMRTGCSLRQEVRFNVAGEIFFHDITIEPLRDERNRVIGVSGAALDITDQKKAECRLEAQYEVARSLARETGIEEAMPHILRAICEHLDWEIGEYWSRQGQKKYLVRSIVWKKPQPLNARFISATESVGKIKPGQEFAGKVWKKRKPIWISDLNCSREVSRKKEAREAGLLSALGLPVFHSGKVIAVLIFLSRQFRVAESGLIESIGSISSQITQFIQRRKVEEALFEMNQTLENRVAERTKSLQLANVQLLREVNERKRLENELLHITEKERQRIGQNLHDELGQQLTGISFLTKSLEGKLQEMQMEEAKDIGNIRELVRKAINCTRGLARGLTVSEMEGEDLITALTNLRDRTLQLFEIECRLQVQGKLPILGNKVTQQLYSVAQEAVTNAIRHGRANRILLKLRNSPTHLVLRISNDGVPFHPPGRTDEQGLGLQIMHYRADVIGAYLEFRTGAKRKGGFVTCTLPLQRHSEG